MVSALALYYETHRLRQPDPATGRTLLRHTETQTERYASEAVTNDQKGHFPLRSFNTDDAEAVLALNAACQPEVGPLNDEKLGRLVDWTPHFKVVERDGLVVAFLIGLTEDAPYESPNFGWFVNQLDSFAYVDRIAVAGQARGTGLGLMLYKDFERWAGSASRPVMCAEVNVEPPNPRSLRFHQIYGFDILEEFEPTSSPNYRVVMLAKNIT